MEFIDIRKNKGRVLTRPFYHIHKLGDSMKKVVIAILVTLLLPMEVFAINDSARSSILVDTDSNRVLYSKNSNEVRSIASISKIMTAIVAIESGKLKKTVTINDCVLRAYGSGIYIKVGEKLTLEDLLYGLMLRSGNDAALAIADYVGGSVSKFVTMMNDKAQKLGMRHTTFNNPSGLDEEEEKGNFSTAYDMALLTSYAMQNETFKKITGTKKYVLKTNKNNYIWYNKNKLLTTYEYTTGGKTGFTKKARRTLVSTASKNNLNLAVVTLDDGNDFQDHKNLHEYGFQNYKKYIFLKKGKITIEDDNYYKHDTLVIKKDLSIALMEDEKDNVVLHYKLKKNRKVSNGDVVGVVAAKIDDTVLAQQTIYFEEKKENKSVKKNKFIDWFCHLW